jgi:hypothetical protein
LKISQPKRFTSLDASFPENGNSRLLKHHSSLKRSDDRLSPKKRRLSVNFSHALFSLLDFLTLADGTDRLSRNVGKKLPLNTA